MHQPTKNRWWASSPGRVCESSPCPGWTTYRTWNWPGWRPRATSWNSPASHTKQHTTPKRSRWHNESGVWRLKPELTVTSGVTSQVTWLIALSLRAADILSCLLCNPKVSFGTVRDVYVPDSLRTCQVFVVFVININGAPAYSFIFDTVIQDTWLWLLLLSLL